MISVLDTILIGAFCFFGGLALGFILWWKGYRDDSECEK